MTDNERWEVLPEELIAAVQSRPVLYNNTKFEYSNKVLKRNVWKEVAQRLSDDWDTLTKGSRIMRCRLVQAKWKHIRDNFRREYHIQTKTKPVDLKKKKYRYYDQLVFLIPFVNSKNNKPGFKPKAELSGFDSNDYQEDYGVEEEKSTSSIHMTTTQEVNLNQNPPNCLSAEYDEDRAFCLSLVQSVKNIDEHHKLSAKIEMLNILRKYSNVQMYSQTQLFVPEVSNTSQNIKHPAEPFTINITPKIRRLSRDDDPLLPVSFEKDQD